MNQFAACVARIFDDQHTPCGAGFLLRDGFVMTCAHVINSARGKPQMATDRPGAAERIKLDFPVSGHSVPVEATVAAWDPPYPRRSCRNSPAPTSRSWSCLHARKE
jgi:hypothetical protein